MHGASVLKLITPSSHSSTAHRVLMYRTLCWCFQGMYYWAKGGGGTFDLFGLFHCYLYTSGRQNAVSGVKEWGLTAVSHGTTSAGSNGMW